MAESSTIMGLVGAFIAIAILLVIGIQILGNVQNSNNCSSLPGLNSSGLTNGTGPFGSFGGVTSHGPIPADYKYSSWALSCLNTNTSTQSAYNLLIVILIVVAAAAILFVVKLI